MGSRAAWSGAACLLIVGLCGCEDNPSATADPAPAQPAATASPDPATAEGERADAEPAEPTAADAEGGEAERADEAAAGDGSAGEKAGANSPRDPGAAQEKTAAKEPDREKADAAAPVDKAEKAEKADAPAEKPKGPIVGERSQLVASATADAGYKCNDAYPHKFITSGGSNVTYPDPKPKGSCAGKKGIAVSVPFVPTAAGPGSISGELRYGICDEGGTNCVIKKKPVTLSFTAH